MKRFLSSRRGGAPRFAGGVGCLGDARRAAASAATATAAASTSAPATTAACDNDRRRRQRSAERACSRRRHEHYDWVLIAIEGLLVIGFIAMGVRSGGVGLGLWGGVGTLVLVFVFGLEPGEPPVDAMLIIVAVIAAAAAMEAAGGIDYMVVIASKALRAQPKRINFVAPFVSYVLCILTGTSNTFYSIIPVINEVAFANKIRPERPLAGSTVASALGITSSPVAAAHGAHALVDPALRGIRSRAGRRTGRLVRGDGALPPSTRAPHSAHRDHPGTAPEDRRGHRLDGRGRSGSHPR